eukprot:Nitzschia sp. Nitz4//scaffold137_size62074//17493//19010//NITZ4_006410-RA/size62074-processed-gene-0.82-mRNA-1//-1//CDS//3329535685//8089//frame0
MSEGIAQVARRVQGATDAPVNNDDDDKNLLSAFVSNILLFLLIFGLSATVRLQDLKHQLTNKFAICTGVAMQFLIMPFLGFSAVVMFNGSGFTQAMGISLLVVTASPGGSYSNWWCSLFNAELALSVAMTSVSSIISLGLLPANLFFYTWLAYTVVLGKDEGATDVDVIGALDFNAIFIALGVVLSAIILGLAAGYKINYPGFHKRANSVGSFCGLCLILFSAFLGGGGGGESETNIFDLPWSFYLGTALPCMVGMSLANIISRSLQLSHPETVAISIECCYQNTAIATSVAITMFDDPDEKAEAVSVPLLYGLVEALIIGIYCVWAWKMGWTKAPADEKLCVVVSNTYEVDESPEEEELPKELPKGWVGRLFVPREVERELIQQHQALPQESPSKPLPGMKGGRDRLGSTDGTVSTALFTPPGTPETLSAGSKAPEHDPETGRIITAEQQLGETPTRLYSQYKIEEDASGPEEHISGNGSNESKSVDMTGLHGQELENENSDSS